VGIIFNYNAPVLDVVLDRRMLSRRCTGCIPLWHLQLLQANWLNMFGRFMREIAGKIDCL